MKNIKKFGLVSFVTAAVLVGGFMASVSVAEAAANITVFSSKVTSSNTVLVTLNDPVMDFS